MAGRKLIDIGANLTDLMFSGVYNGSVKHPPDHEIVLSRAFDHGLDKIIVTAGCFDDIKSAKLLCASDERLYYTVGCHPTRCMDFHKDPDSFRDALQRSLTEDTGKVVAVGECGLDYDRENFCPRGIQQTYFSEQLKLASLHGLPLFLHCRGAHADLVSLLRKHMDEYGPVQGVVHTFDGSLEEASEILLLGLYLGFNGCSLKTEANLKAASLVPLNKILLETDAPWCDIRASHAGFKYVRTRFEKKKSNKWCANCMVVGRNEPACIVQVLEVLAGSRGISEADVANAAYENSLDLFACLRNK